MLHIILIGFLLFAAGMLMAGIGGAVTIYYLNKWFTTGKISFLPW